MLGLSPEDVKEIEGSAQGTAAQGPMSGTGRLRRLFREEYNSPNTRRLASPEACLRYVSMLPFLSDWDAFGRSTDIWSTSAQTLGMGAGDWEEHSVLLLNYLLWLQSNEAAVLQAARGGPKGLAQTLGALTAIGAEERLRGWRGGLVIGNSLVHGETCWVLWGRGIGQEAGDQGQMQRQLSAGSGGTTEQVLLIEAATGRVYDASDSQLPLVSVGLVATGSNLYANVQRTGSPRDMTWALDDLTAWQPFVKPGQAALNVRCVQPEIVYTPPLSYESARLAKSLEDTLVACFRRWRRPRYRRLHHRYDLVEPLRLRLDELEARAAATGASMGLAEGWSAAGAGAGRDLSAQHLDELHHRLVGRRVSGFPLNFTFSDLPSVVEAVRATEAHTVDDERAEFAIAARAFAYPCAVVSVWVYVVILLPGR